LGRRGLLCGRFGCEFQNEGDASVENQERKKYKHDAANAAKHGLVSVTLKSRNDRANHFPVLI
jgi:hypothetical protein